MDESVPNKIRSHRDLVVWRLAMDLAVEVYQLSRTLPKDELYRLTSQVTRAVASVPANIAEGSSRGSRREYAYFCSIAKGSLMETETLVTLMERLNYVSAEQTRCIHSMIERASKMITALRSRLRINDAKG